MFKPSPYLSAAAAKFVYSVLANLLTEMEACFRGSGHRLTRPKQIAWCHFEVTLAALETHLKAHQAQPPKVELCLSGLPVDELEKLALTSSDAVEIAKALNRSLMFVCRQLKENFGCSASLVTPDMRAGRRQLQKWCHDSQQELRRLRVLERQELIAHRQLSCFVPVAGLFC